MITRRALLRDSATAAAAMMLLGACGRDRNPTTHQPSGGSTASPPPVRTGHLQVPGARLYYEVRGAGQPLLLIHGGATDAGSFAAVAPELSGRYTVITYDRRGNSRSRLDGPPADLRLDQQAQDAGMLLEELVDEPPHVFGSSGGGVVALELAARYGDRLGTVVSHEPPVSAVLPDAAEQQAGYDQVYQTYRSAGVERAFQQFMALDPGAEDPRAGGEYPADPQLGERLQGNLEFLLAHEMLPFTRYQPDISALGAKLPKLILGVGHYQAKVATRIVQTLATRLGTAAVEFPGDHTGYMWRPREFATTLRELLSEG